MTPDEWQKNSNSYPPVNENQYLTKFNPDLNFHPQSIIKTKPVSQSKSYYKISIAFSRGSSVC